MNVPILCINLPSAVIQDVCVDHDTHRRVLDRWKNVERELQRHVPAESRLHRISAVDWRKLPSDVPLSLFFCGLLFFFRRPQSSTRFVLGSSLEGENHSVLSGLSPRTGKKSPVTQTNRYTVFGCHPVESHKVLGGTDCLCKMHSGPSNWLIIQPRLFYPFEKTWLY
jgi:hypothetical protein